MHKIQSNLQTDQNSIFRTNIRRRNGLKKKKVTDYSNAFRVPYTS